MPFRKGKSMKDFVSAVISLVLFVGLIAFVVWAIIGFANATGDLLESLQEREEAKEYCFEHGYLGVKWANGKYYCYNSEKVVPID